MTPGIAPEADAAREVASRVWALVETHEATCDADPCLFRAGLLAYIGHTIGLRWEAHLYAIGDAMLEYEAHCPKCQAGAEPPHA